MTIRNVPGGTLRTLRMSGATAAMERAAATATRRASRTRIGTPASNGVEALPERVDEQHPTFDAAVGRLLTRSERTLVWVADHLDGVRIRALPRDKRLQLAGGCFHIAIEHGQAIVVLTQEKCFGSALALQRPLVEAFNRGLWLLHAATNKQMEAAGEDNFPCNKDIVESLRPAVGARLLYLNNELWPTLCSYTHTGYQQIGARLSPEGLKSNYKLDEIQQALCRSDMIQLVSAIELANAAGEEALSRTILQRLKAYDQQDQQRREPRDG